MIWRFRKIFDFQSYKPRKLQLCYELNITNRLRRRERSLHTIGDFIVMEPHTALDVR